MYWRTVFLGVIVVFIGGGIFLAYLFSLTPKAPLSLAPGEREVGSRSGQKVKSERLNRSEHEMPDINSAPVSFRTVLSEPEDGLYFGVFADFGVWEDTVSLARIRSFEKTIGKPIGWAYFSANWKKQITFPTSQVALLVRNGVTPFLRIMPRRDFSSSPNSSPFTLASIIEGKYDEALRRFARDAKSAAVPILMEFGTEVNGNWFPWSGVQNGGEETMWGNPRLADGPERFKSAFRHLVGIFRDEDVRNVTWFFHINAQSDPPASWNEPMAYYPGDDYIDWIGVSVYGPQRPGDVWESFAALYEPVYREIISRSEKPIAIVEFGVREDFTCPSCKAEWLSSALAVLKKGKFPRTKAFSFWHSRWVENGVVVNLRIDSSTSALRAVQEGIKGDWVHPALQFAEVPITSAATE